MPNTFSNTESIAQEESLHNQLKKINHYPSTVEGGGFINQFPTLACHQPSIRIPSTTHFGGGRCHQNPIISYIYHLESRWPATPMYLFIMAPYKSPHFGGCAIYFHYGVFVVHLKNNIFVYCYQLGGLDQVCVAFAAKNKVQTFGAYPRKKIGSV